MSPDSRRPLQNADGYGQLCAVGYALDAIGDRWTLLILRDLARASLRFSDVQAINPGVSPNILTTRLRKLEASGLIERRPLPHSSTGHLYSLTEDTKDVILPVLTATADLGAFLIDRIPLEELATMDLAQILTDQMNLNGHFVAAKTSNLRGYFLLDLGGIKSHITINDRGMQSNLEITESASEARATVSCFPPSVLMRLMGRGLTVEVAESAGLLTISGEREAALELIELLSFSSS